MKNNKIILLILGLLIILLTVFYSSSGFIFIAAIILTVLIAFVISIFKIIKKRPVKQLIWALSKFILLLIIGILIGLFIPYEEAVLKKSLLISEQIEYAYNSDQSDRKTLKTYLLPNSNLLINNRDSLRLNFSIKIVNEYEQDKIELTDEDKFYLAMILHHGKTTKDYEKAHLLAIDAANSENKIQNAEWLEKATYDRLQISKGKKQKYGTQSGDIN